MSDLANDSVCYWRMCQPQVEQSDSWLEQEEEEEEYEIVTSHTISEDLQVCWDFYNNQTPLGEFCYKVAASAPVQFGIQVLVAVIRRVTDSKHNWQHHPLRSFLESLLGLTVSLLLFTSSDGMAIYALSGGILSGVCLAMCEEVLFGVLFPSLLRVALAKRQFVAVVELCGFEVMSNGHSLRTDEEKLSLFKTVVFGVLGVYLCATFGISNASSAWPIGLVLIGMIIGVVVLSEFCCSWIPTRRVGLTLQSRFTNAAENWSQHYWRSFIEVGAWISSICYLYLTTKNVIYAVELGTLVAICISLLSGINQIESATPSRRPLDSTIGGGMFWQGDSAMDKVIGLTTLGISSFLVSVDNTMTGKSHSKSD